jgi:small-conductance mechanosensitive channel
MLNLEELINQMGNVPAGDGGNVDLGPLQMVITKMQSQLNQKANSSDFESLREALLLKADKKQTQKEIDRLDALIEQLKQGITGFEDDHRKLKNEVDRLNQLVEML